MRVVRRTSQDKEKEMCGVDSGSMTLKRQTQQTGGILTPVETGIELLEEELTLDAQSMLRLKSKSRRTPRAGRSFGTDSFIFISPSTRLPKRLG
jgi:hypothetical protein